MIFVKATYLAGTRPCAAYFIALNWPEFNYATKGCTRFGGMQFLEVRQIPEEKIPGPKRQYLTDGKDSIRGGTFKYYYLC